MYKELSSKYKFKQESAAKADITKDYFQPWSMIKNSFARWIPGVFKLTRSPGIFLRELHGSDPDWQSSFFCTKIQLEIPLSFRANRDWLFVSPPSSAFLFFQAKFSS